MGSVNWWFAIVLGYAQHHTAISVISSYIPEEVWLKPETGSNWLVTFSVNLPRKKTSKFDHQRILVLVIFSVASAHPQDVKKRERRSKSDCRLQQHDWNHNFPIPISGDTWRHPQGLLAFFAVSYASHIDDGFRRIVSWSPQEPTGWPFPDYS